MVILVAFVFLRTAGGMGWFDFMPSGVADIVFSVIVQIGLMTLVPIIGIMIYRKKFCRAPTSFSEFVQAADENNDPRPKAIMKSWWFRKPSGSLIGWSILLGVFCFLFNIFVSSFFNGILAGLGHRGAAGGGMGGEAFAFTGVGGLMVMLVIVAVLPGFCEEVTHRGMLIHGFAGKIGIMKAILVSSVLFGLMHLNIVQAIYAMILGYLMALVVMATKNIWPAVIEHFMNNALAVYLMFASHYGWFGGNFFSWLGNFFGSTSFLIYLGAFVGLYFLIIAIIHKLARDTFVRENATRETPLPLHRSSGMQAIKYYITADEKPIKEPLTTMERTMYLGILFLGLVVTGMTLVWGFL